MRSYRQYCALARALDVVGDRWTLLIVRELGLRGPSRYTDLQYGLPGLDQNLPAEPDLVLSGDPDVIVGLLTRRIDVRAARRRGLSVKGDAEALDRLQPQA